MEFNPFAPESKSTEKAEYLGNLNAVQFFSLKAYCKLKAEIDNPNSISPVLLMQKTPENIGHLEIGGEVILEGQTRLMERNSPGPTAIKITDISEFEFTDGHFYIEGKMNFGKGPFTAVISDVDMNRDFKALKEITEKARIQIEGYETFSIETLRKETEGLTLKELNEMNKDMHEKALEENNLEKLTNEDPTLADLAAMFNQM